MKRSIFDENEERKKKRYLYSGITTTVIDLSSFDKLDGNHGGETIRSQSSKKKEV